MQAREQKIDMNSFARRHIGPNEDEVAAMLSELELESIERLIDAAVPRNIRLHRQLNLPESKSEIEALAELQAIAKKNKVARSFIGAGYYDCITPPVIQRNILENPGWYTAYTPYQAEIAQGRLEALLNFQQMIIDLTALDIANASMLDEATAAAEAMALCHAVVPNRTRRTSPRPTKSNVTCPLDWWAFHTTLKVDPRIASHCKRASNTSAATKRPATSVRQKFSWPSLRRCMRFITVPKDCARSSSVFTG